MRFVTVMNAQLRGAIALKDSEILTSAEDRNLRGIYISGNRCHRLKMEDTKQGFIEAQAKSMAQTFPAR